MGQFVKIRDGRVEVVSYETAERIACIFGPSSAAWKALDEFDWRKAAGEDVEIFRGGSWSVVGWRPDPQPLS